MTLGRELPDGRVLFGDPWPVQWPEPDAKHHPDRESMADQFQRIDDDHLIRRAVKAMHARTCPGQIVTYLAVACGVVLERHPVARWPGEDIEHPEFERGWMEGYGTGYGQAADDWDAAAAGLLVAAHAKPRRWFW